MTTPLCARIHKLAMMAAVLSLLVSCPVAADEAVAKAKPIKVGFYGAAYSMDEESSPVDIRVDLSAAPTKTVSVDYSVAAGTAEAGVDFVAATGTLTFNSGVRYAFLVVDFIDDSEAEPDETILLSLSNPNGVKLGLSEAVLTIRNAADGDPPPVATAVINAPGDGSTFVPGAVVTMDGTSSVAPAGFTTWFAALEQNSGDPMTAAHSGTGLNESFTSSDVSGYVLRLVVADAAAMPSDVELRGSALPCVDTPVCDSAQVIISKDSGGGCTYTVQPDSGCFTSATATASFFVTASGDRCKTNATTTASWIDLSKPKGSGSRTIEYTVSRNAFGGDAGDRSGTIVIQDGAATYTVTQDGAYGTPGCTGGGGGGGGGGTGPVTAFETGYAFPEVVFLRWSSPSAPTLERSSDGGGSWLAVGATEPYFVRDTAVTGGVTYHYRAQSAGSTSWTYLGGGSTSPGDSIATPLWTAPRPVPRTVASFYPQPVITWTLPLGGTIFDAVGTYTIRLDPEPGETLAGTTIDIYVNEDTFQMTDGLGDPIFNSLTTGRDDPACVVRKAIPDLTVEVPVDQDMVTVNIPNVIYGTNGLRFVVTDAQGGTSERALLVPVTQAPLNVDKTARPLFFGDVTAPLEPAFWGLGPVSQPSPDCWDRDTLTAEDEHLTTSGLSYWNAGSRVGTQADVPRDGIWFYDHQATGNPAFGNGDIPEWFTDYTANIGNTGRRIVDAAGVAVQSHQGKDNLMDFGPTAMGWDLKVGLTTSRSNKNNAPVIEHFPTQVVATEPSGPATAHVEFRLVDSYQDVDLVSFTISNPDLPGVTSPVIYAQSQERADGRFGWVVAEAPINASLSSNTLVVSGSDRAGKSVNESFVVTVAVPEAVARITGPADGASYKSGAIFDLDGSTSVGAGAVRWLFFDSDGISHTYLSGRDISGNLEPSMTMPSYVADGMIVRLVVAVTPADMPSFLSGSELPCSILQGDTRCDTVEIYLDNTCCHPVGGCSFGSTLYNLDILEPLSGIELPADQPVTVSAQAATPNAAYRYWVEPAGDSAQRRLIDDPAAWDNGFTPNASVTLSPAELGLGSWTVIVEASDAPSGCIANVLSKSTTFHLVDLPPHELAALAPGQAFAGDSLRVYTPTFADADTALVLIDNDLDDAVAGWQLPAIVSPALYADVTLPNLAPGTYWVAVAADDGSRESMWKQALLITEPTYQVINEEDESCGGPGTECSHGITAGQTVTGNWADPGDSDYYWFTAGPGMTYRVVLERVDTSLSPFHPDSVDPEILIADPDGMVDAAHGSANDRSADDTDAEITSYVTPKTGMYTIIVRSTKGYGDYRLILERTATAANAGFSVKPYGARAVNIVEAPGEPMTASLNAVLLDPRGLPVGGADIDWSLYEGSVGSSNAFISNSDGVAQIDVTLDGTGLASLAAGFDWPALKNLPAPQKSAVEIPAPGALAGIIVDNGRGAIVRADLHSPSRIRALREASLKVVEAAAPRPAVDSKILAPCPEIDAARHVVRRLTLPEGAVSIESVKLELTDQAGVVVTDTVTGLAAAQREDFKAKLIATCLDAQGGTFEAPLPGAEIFINVKDMREEYTRGVVTGAGTCSSTMLSMAGELEPFTLEVGERSILVSLDAAGVPAYSVTEVLAANTRVKVKSGQDWQTSMASTDIEVAPEPNGPQAILWLHPQDFVSPKGIEQALLLTGGANGAFYVEGPHFALLDEFGNFVVGWGKDDSAHHLQVGSDKVYTTRAGGASQTWGSRPWQTIDFDMVSNPTTYRTRQFISDDGAYLGYTDDSYFFFGQSSFQACFENALGAQVCDTASVNNSAADWALYLLDPALDHTNTTGPTYVDQSETANEASWHTSPGQQLTYKPSGKPVLVRVEPKMTDDNSQPHDQVIPRTDPVVTKIWVSGPTSSPGAVRQTREGPNDPMVYPKVADVEICTGTLDATTYFEDCCLEWADSNGNSCTPGFLDCACVTMGQCERYGELAGGCDTTWTGEATLPAWTDEYGAAGVAMSDHSMPVFGISKAPAEPGWYTVVVESEDSRLGTYSAQGRKWASLPFEVEGGVFLDSEYRTVSEISVSQPRQAYVYLGQDSTAGIGESILVSSYSGSGDVLTEDAEVILSPLGVGGSFVGAIVLQPEGQTQGRKTLSNKLLSLTGPTINVAPGTGNVKAFSFEKRQLAEVIAGFSAKLQLLFLTRDLPSGGGKRQLTNGDGKTQETDIGSEIDDYAEKIWVRIQAVNENHPELGPLNVAWEVGIAEEPNPNFIRVVNAVGTFDGRFFDGENGATLLDEVSGEIGPVGNRSTYHLSNGVLDLPMPLVSKTLPKWWTDHTDNTDKIFQYLPYRDGYGARLKAIPGPSAMALLFPPKESDMVEVEIWVDEQKYDLRRGQSPPLGWSPGLNEVTDWLEKKVWDYLATQHLNHPDPEVEAALSLPENLTQEVSDRVIASVKGSKSDPLSHFTINWNPAANGIRLPLPNRPQGWSQFNYGFEIFFDSNARVFDNAMIHEPRHAWQYHLSASLAHADQETPTSPESIPGDFLVVDPPQSATELSDGGFGSESHQNTDFHYRGDGLRDNLLTVRSALERDAVRFANAVLNDNLDCVMDSAPTIDSHQMQSTIGVPVFLVAHAKYDVKNDKADLAGAPIRWSVSPSSCKLMCGAEQCSNQSPIRATDDIFAPNGEMIAARSIIGVTNSTDSTCTVTALMLHPLGSTDCSPTQGATVSTTTTVAFTN